MTTVKIRPIEKWVALQGIADELVDDGPVLEIVKGNLIDDGIEEVRLRGYEPTGVNSVELVENLFPGMSRDPYNYRLRAVVHFYGDEEEVDEEELHQP